MPKVEISTSKGVVQSSGEGLHIIGGTLSDSVGIHTLQELVTLSNTSMQRVNTDEDSSGITLSKKLPAQSQILNTSVTIIQKPTAGAQINLNLIGHPTVVTHDGALDGAELCADFDIGTSGLAVGATVAAGVKTVGANNVIHVSHAANNNAVAVTGEAKILVTIVYAGKGEPVAVA